MSRGDASARRPAQAASKSSKSGSAISVRKRWNGNGHAKGMPRSSRYQLRQPVAQTVFFAAATRCLRRGGLFAFSTERCDAHECGTAGWVERASERIAHCPEYLRWLAVSRIVLDNFTHIRTSVLTQNERALEGLRFGANDFDLPTEDEVTQKAGATVSHEFEHILDSGRALGIALRHRAPF